MPKTNHAADFNVDTQLRQVTHRQYSVVLSSMDLEKSEKHP